MQLWGKLVVCSTLSISTLPHTSCPIFSLFPVVMKRITLLATLAVAGLLTACGDDNDTPTPSPTPTNTELLMAKSWTLTALTLKEGSDPEVNIFAIADACSKDDKYKFQASGVFVFDESTNVCAGEPQTVTGIWGLADNDKTLTLSAINRSTSTLVELSGTIDELTTSKLMVTESSTEDGVTTVARYTFSGN